MQITWIRWLFGISAAYDGLLGLLFLFAAERVFEAFGVTPPNHYGYVQFPALLLIIFAVMFVQVAVAPSQRRDWIPYGAGLKAAYSGVAFSHFFFGRIPSMWMPLAYADLAFFVLFMVAWYRMKPSPCNRTQNGR